MLKPFDGDSTTGMTWWHCVSKDYVGKIHNCPGELISRSSRRLNHALVGVSVNVDCFRSEVIVRRVNCDKLRKSECERGCVREQFNKVHDIWNVASG